MITLTTKKETEKLITSIVSKTVDELLKQNMLKKSDKNTYQKTEQLLYNYKNFKSVIKDKQDMIEQIKRYGMPKRSISVIPMPENLGYKPSVREQDKIDEAIDELKNSITVTSNFIKIIDSALNSIKDDPYYKIIEMCYFESKKYSAIAKEWDYPISEVTICKNKNRLVKKLSIYLFSDDVIKEIYS